MNCCPIVIGLILTESFIVTSEKNNTPTSKTNQLCKLFIEITMNWLQGEIAEIVPWRFFSDNGNRSRGILCDSHLMLTLLA